ncbi:MAG: hypothetical protein A2W35_17485 [Chloroflexi bacterium RBG_16_57_11]|nr:MAG: hypothetical protein A2W35_17485 [Chloroflexi bacterium RBG_16_57_11]
MNPPPAPEPVDPTNPTGSPDSGTSSTDFVWTFRGYHLRASEFTTAMSHFFRAEVQRANVWRQRLDTTTNWAVVTTGAAISIAFAQSGNHVVILLNILLVTIFLLIEARRYRYYELWAYRVRLMETDFFAAMLVPPFHPSADWAEALSESLLHPHFPISSLESIGRRLRRNFLYIYGVIGAAWLGKLWLMPTPTENSVEFFKRAAIGPVSGETILLAVLVFAVIILLVGFGTVGLQDAAGEVLPRFGAEVESMAGKKAAWFRPSRRRLQLLTFIITDQNKEVAEKILKDMRRGVTAIPGTGMYTGKEHSILMCALTVTEIPQVKDLVAQVDPNAFVVVMPAREVLGKGFLPLHQE